MGKLFKVVSPGMYSTFQDGGRVGYLSSGLSNGGAMDKIAMMKANIALGNEEGDLVLEVYLIAPVLEVLLPIYVATDPAIASLVVNGKRTTTPARLVQGDLLTIELKDCAYGYIAVQGGFIEEKTYGSSSWHMIAQVGKKPLKKDSVLYGRENTDNLFPNHLAKIKDYPIHNSPIKLRKGPEFKAINGIKDFLQNQPFVISASSNRMAVNLTSSAPISHDYEMDSSPVLPGIIQLPPLGNPIVLGMDCQTIGGYPRVAGIIEEDLRQLFQYRPGAEIHFIWCD